MKIDLFEPMLVDGLTSREVTLTEDFADGLTQRVVATVWITPDDSGKAMAAASKTAAIALLERALAALRA